MYSLHKDSVNEIRKRIGSMDGKYDLMNEKLTEMNVLLDDYNNWKSEICDHRRKLKILEEKNKELERKVGSLEKKVDGLEEKVDGLEEKVDGLEENVDEVFIFRRDWSEEDIIKTIHDSIININGELNKAFDDLFDENRRSIRGMCLYEIAKLKRDYDKEIENIYGKIYCISIDFATKSDCEEIKQVTIANKRNIISSCSLCMEYITSVIEWMRDTTDLPPASERAKNGIYMTIKHKWNERNPVVILKMINDRRKVIREHVYKEMYKRELNKKSLDELREIAKCDKISDVEIFDAIEGPDDKNSGYEADKESEVTDKEYKKTGTNSHDNLRKIIILKRLSKLNYPKDQYKWRRISEWDNTDRKIIWKEAKKSEPKKISDFAGLAPNFDILENHYNKGFTDEPGYDDY